ncbi:Hypothetical_protein [Hexamita inflata]|uniref:Hypothetical_protein n=1 Tax=Hexamita inflata TaxID=28002 RepID=A0AA86N437_9EUKA|nr:Hypothetical protein HINF_LOCUS38 [Hexamita inflata]
MVTFNILKSSHSCCKSSIISGCSETAGSSVDLGFAFLPCSHTLEAWRRSQCPTSSGVAVSLLTMFYCDCFIVQSVGDQTGVTQLGFFVSAPLQGSSACSGKSLQSLVDTWQANSLISRTQCRCSEDYYDIYYVSLLNKKKKTYLSNLIVKNNQIQQSYNQES